MQVKVRKRGKFAILEVSGKMLITNVDVLLERFITLLNEGERTFIIDMTKVSDTSTEGINTVVACRNKAVKRDGSVGLVLNARLRYYYTILFLDTIFEIFEDVEDALASPVGQSHAVRG